VAFAAGTDPEGVTPGTVPRVAAAKGPGRRASRRVPDDGTDRIKTVARNRRARHDYDILETYECGLALQGSEVKSLRAGRVTLADAYARVEGGEAWLLGVHIPPYEHAAGFGAHDPERRRKLLMHRDEIDELMGQTQQKALTLVPLSIYFKEGRAKVELALAKGRRLYDKRHAIATRDAERDAAREARFAAGKSVGRGARKEYD
jgi:SsrA-binding protein